MINLCFPCQKQSIVVVLEQASHNRGKKKEIGHEWNGEDLLRILASWKSHPSLFFRWFPLLRAFLLLHRKNFAARRV